MRKTLVIFAAIGLGVGGLAMSEAAAGELVPGGWLQSSPIPQAAPLPPIVRAPAARPAPRRIVRRRVPVRRPPARPQPAQPADGKVRF